MDAEFERVIPIALRWGVDPAFIMAIRKTENGGPGREFGVVSRPAPTWEDQCNWACVAVKTHMVDMKFEGTLHLMPDGTHRYRYHPNWIAQFKQRWAPAGAANDPKGLNANWLKNIEYWYTYWMDATVLPFHG